jgi:hypothetical protein
MFDAIDNGRGIYAVSYLVTRTGLYQLSGSWLWNYQVDLARMPLVLSELIRVLRTDKRL